MALMPLSVIGQTTPKKAGPEAGAPAPVNNTSLKGKLMVGYQGWFSCKGDGAGMGWLHWAKNRGRDLAPGNAQIDLWPDMTEYGANERFKTGFKHADGRVAEVFSSFHPETVMRHFQWMREYDIDGAFLQRFPVNIPDGVWLKRTDAVLEHCRAGAEANGRVFAVMYDLTGMRRGRMKTVTDDWRRLRDEMRITSGESYLCHRGKPLVAVWGVGFDEKSDYTLGDCRELVDFFRAEGCSIMLGVPTGWREQRRDAVKDRGLHEVLKLADVISPWTVGRYRNLNEVKRHGEQVWRPDVKWCREAGIDFLPVGYPGFSWHNMYGGISDDIPRLKGKFLWSQFVAAKRAGAEMIYVAMFDEVDEGTAIFKCTNDTPTDQRTKFLTYEGLPSDFYLRLTGAGGKMLRGEIPATDTMPSVNGVNRR